MKNVVKSLGVLAAYFVVQIIVQMVFMAAGIAYGIRSENGLLEFSMDHLFLMTILSNIIMLILLVLFARLRKKSVRVEWGLKQVRAGMYIQSAAAAFMLSFAWTLISYDLSFSNAQQMERSAAFYSEIFPGLGGVMMALTLLFAQPIVEEVMCRSIILNGLKSSMPIWTAVITSSMLFGAVHLLAGGIWLAAGAAVMGLCFGIIFVKAESLYAAVVAHIFANLPDFFMPYLPEIGNGMRGALALLLIVGAGVMLYFLSKRGNAHFVK